MKLTEENQELLRKILGGFVADPEFVIADDAWLDAPAVSIDRFHIYSHSEMLSRPRPQWIIPGVLPHAELASIFGESGSGKSFLAYDMVAAIQRGIPWNDTEVKQGDVLVIAAEGASGMRNRAEAYARQNPDATPQDLPRFISDAPNMLEPKDSALLAKRCADAGPWLVIVVDTLSAVTPGADESSSKDMGKVLAHCKLLHRETGALVVLIDHSGVASKERSRGWSGKKAAYDAEIHVTRDGDNRAWKVSKAKDGPDGVDGPGYGFRLRKILLDTDERGNEITSCVVEHCAPTVGKAEGLGPYETATMAMVNASAELQFDTDDIYEHVKETIPHKGEGRDQRKTTLKRALERLVKRGLMQWVDIESKARIAKTVHETKDF